MTPTLPQIRENVARAIRDRRSGFADGQPDVQDYATADRIIAGLLGGLTAIYGEASTEAAGTSLHENMSIMCHMLEMDRRAFAELALKEA